jgi:hypothetical protein
MSYSLDSEIVENDSNAVKSAKYATDPRLLVPLKGHTYTVRLVSITNAKSGRKSPFIVKWNHTSTNLNMTTGEYETEFVTCPTSSYVKCANPFDACPCCSAANEIWKKYEATKNVKYRQIYDKMKRRFSAFIPVLILSNTENAEYNGKIKIMTLNNRNVFKEFSQFLEQNSKRLFFNNFDNPEAKNLVLTVTTEKAQDGNEYRRFQLSESISGKKLCNELTPEWIAKFLKEKIVPLQFDEDFMTPYSEDAINNFYERRIAPLFKNSKIEDTAKAAAKASESNDDIFDISSDSAPTQSNPQVSASQTESAASAVSDSEQEEIIADVDTTKKDAPPAKQKVMSDQELEDFLETI